MSSSVSCLGLSPALEPEPFCRRRPNCIMPPQSPTLHGLRSPREGCMGSPFRKREGRPVGPDCEDRGRERTATIRSQRGAGVSPSMLGRPDVCPLFTVEQRSQGKTCAHDTETGPGQLRRRGSRNDRIIREQRDHTTHHVSVLQEQGRRHAGEGHHREDVLALPRMRKDLDGCKPRFVLEALVPIVMNGGPNRMLQRRGSRGACYDSAA